MKNKSLAFSLIEVVIALGLFAFCIVGIVGILPIAANSVKSVSQETNANNIAESIAGLWLVTPTNSTPVSISIPVMGNRTMGNFTIGPTSLDSTSYYYDNDARITNQPSSTLLLNYSANPIGNNTFTVNLTFTWPANAPADSKTLNTRTFNYIFAK
jgi:Tfp pilus assembly protein PilV